ncbi:MAG: hypothetical protein NZ480_09200, partial [Bdellovibrionaceae bacterium]|nr:hypothetical protein [Pseudobdellovibrionaceae bacterium]
PQLRLLAAHLYLDALAIHQDDLKILDVIKKLIEWFPEKVKTFKEIANKATLNWIGKSGMSNPRRAYELIKNEMWWDVLDQKDRIIALKNALLLAYRLRRFYDVIEWSDQLLPITLKDRELRQIVLKARASAAEWIFDFPLAYATWLSLESNSFSHQVRLALLSRLSSEPDKARKHLEQAFRRTHDPNQKVELFFEILELHSSPKNWLQNNRQWLLRENRESFYQGLVRAVSLSGDFSIFNLAENNLNPQPSAFWERLVWRYQVLSTMDQEFFNLKSAQLDLTTDRAIQKSIKDRVRLIGKIEKMIEQHLKVQDDVVRLVLLAHLSFELERFYNELITLPVPSGLSEGQAEEYRSVLVASASPYLKKAEALRFWTKNDVAEVGKYYQSIVNAEQYRSVSPILIKEWEIVRKSPIGYHDQIESFIVTVHSDQKKDSSTSGALFSHQKLPQTELKKGALKDWVNQMKEIGNQYLSALLDIKWSELQNEDYDNE